MQKIAIFGVPRSGTTWLAQIFNSHPQVALRYQPLFSYGHKAALGPQSTRDEIIQFFESILRTTDEFALLRSGFHHNQPVFEKDEQPNAVVFKEVRYLHIIGNMLEQANDVHVVGIVRNPLAVLASWIQAPKEFDPHWDVHQEWREAQSKNQGRPEEFYGFQRWIDATEAFLTFERQFPKKFHLVRYRDLLQVPEQTVTKLFEALGLSVSPSVLSFLEASRTQQDDDPYAVFKVKKDDSGWKRVLPPSIITDVQQELAGTRYLTFLDE